MRKAAIWTMVSMWLSAAQSLPFVSPNSQGFGPTHVVFNISAEVLLLQWGRNCLSGILRRTAKTARSSCPYVATTDPYFAPAVRDL